MPRKRVIHWMAVPPNDLTKCHNKRCDQTAAQDRLCVGHHVVWRMNGFQPEMPSYSGDKPVTENPLQRELKELRGELRQLSDEVAALRVDDKEGLADLEAAKKYVEGRIAELKTKHAESIAPFVEAQLKTTSWFDEVGGEARKTLSLINQRTETARSSVFPTLSGRSIPPAAPVARRRTIVNIQRPKLRSGR